MSLTKISIAANVAAPAVGIAGGAFVKWAGFDWAQFLVFAALMAASIAAGAFALYSEIQTQPGVSPEEVARQRRKIVGRSIAQHMLGMVFVYQTDSAVWVVVLVGLMLGGGPVMATMLKDLKNGLSGNVDPPDGT